MKVIQAYMGHSTMSITADTYSHLDTRATSIAGMKLGSLIGNKDE
jgi:integrase